MTPDYLRKLMMLGALIEHYFEIERYIDSAGVVWVGYGEAPNEVWVIESGPDEGHYIMKDVMMKKMSNELLTEAEMGHPEGSVKIIERKASCPTRLMDGRNEIRCWFDADHEGDCK